MIQMTEGFYSSIRKLSALDMAKMIYTGALSWVEIKKALKDDWTKFNQVDAYLTEIQRRNHG